MKEILDAIGREKCSAILRWSDAVVARGAMEAAIRGGFRVVEVTLTTPGALDLVRDLACREGLLVGTGTVLTPEQAEQSVTAGARFLVSPVMDPAVIARGHELGALVVPGVSTPTEMWQAVRAGAQLLKLFPAAEKGPDYVKACLGPLPELRIMPTSGVTADNAVAFLRAGAFALGLVGPLFDPTELGHADYAAIEERARSWIELVRPLRGSSLARG